MSDESPAIAYVEQLLEELGHEGAHDALDEAFADLSVVELAALEHDWAFWAKPKQLPPIGEWRSWGFLGARGLGKTRSCTEFINDEVFANRAGSIGLAAQNEDKSVEIQIEGKSGLIATARPWFKPKWEATKKELVWPNGARAIVYTPESPGPIRGGEFDLAWLSELQSWPAKTRFEAYANFLFATRIGYARLIWDASPKKGHPILLALLRRVADDAEKHFVVRGRTHENAANLAAGVIEDLEREFGGTQKGREELGGEMLDDSEGAVAKQAWIDDNRRPMPDRFARRALAIDCAVTKRASSDRSGISEAGLGADGQGYVLGDYSDKYDPPSWAALLLDRYVAGECDVIVCETNKGGDLVVQNLRAAAQGRKLTVVVLGKAERAKPHQRGIVQVREVYSKGAKLDRAQPLSTAYERGRVSHVEGVDLSSLELTLTTWEPAVGSDSPDDLDALTLAMTEILDLTVNKPDPRKGFKGILQAAHALQKPTQTQRMTRLEEIFGRGRRGI